MTENNRFKSFDTQVENISERTFTKAFHLIELCKDSLASWLLFTSVHENSEIQETNNCSEFQRYHC